MTIGKETCKISDTRYSYSLYLHHLNHQLTILLLLDLQGHLFCLPDAQGLLRYPLYILQIELEAFAQEHGPGALHLRLEKVDPEAAHRIHPHDLRRTIRALEVYLRTGTPISRLQQEETPIGFPVPSLIFGLTRNRRELYGRIDQRAEAMLARGLIEEVKGLLDRGYAESRGQRAAGRGLNQLPSLEAFGYRDLIDYLRGRQPLEDALRSFQRDTKRYAKRQLTWFSRERVLRWFDLSVVSHKEALSNMVEEIVRVI